MNKHKYGYSYPDGKLEIQSFLWRCLPFDAKILDVGAGEGTYYHLLGPNYQWSAVEIWHETVEYIRNFYDIVYEDDIRNFIYPDCYDLIIFGDVLEHLTVKEAQKVLINAKQHTQAILIAVPYCLEQEPIYGNEAERHLQPDLTPQIFNERYPGFDQIFSNQIYGYYYWTKGGQTNDYWTMCNS